MDMSSVDSKPPPSGDKHDRQNISDGARDVVKQR